MSPLRSFFGSARWGDQNVVTVFGAPDRAHTEAARVFAQRAGLTRQQIEDQGVPSPFMSIWRSHPSFEQERDSRAVIRGINRNIKTGTALKMRYPRPMTSDIQVDLWCGEGGHMIAEHVSAQIETQFPHESVYLPIDWTLDKYYKPPFDAFSHTKTYGRTRGRLIQSQGWTDNSALEMAQGNKTVRLSWTGKYEFYLPYRPEEGRIVRDVGIDLFDDVTGELLESLNVSTED